MNTPMLLLALLSGLTLALMVCLRRIPEGQAYTLRRVDGRLRTVGAGVHLVLPLLERVTVIATGRSTRRVRTTGGDGVAHDIDVDYRRDDWPRIAAGLGAPAMAQTAPATAPAGAPSNSRVPVSPMPQ